MSYRKALANPDDTRWHQKSFSFELVQNELPIPGISWRVLFTFIVVLAENKKY
jgi:hypothetical protein